MKCYKCDTEMELLFEEERGLYLKGSYKCPNCNTRRKKNIRKTTKLRKR